MEGGDNNIYISEMSFVADFSNTVAKLSQQQNAMRYECFAVVRVIFSFRLVDIPLGYARYPKTQYLPEGSVFFAVTNTEKSSPDRRFVAPA